MEQGRGGRRWILLLVGLPVFGLLGLWSFMSLTAPILHPDPKAIPSATDPSASAQAPAAVEQARQIVRAGLSTQNLPGLSVAVGMRGEIVWAEGFGFADLKSSTPVTPRHRFRIGTASTALTSAGVGRLLEDGRLELDSEIQSYVPEYPKKPWPVTLRHLMGHTAGLVSDGGDEGPLFGTRCDKPVEALPHFAERALLFEPGTQYRYSSYGWILLSAAIESAAAEAFLPFMRERVFDPLGMSNTVPDAPPGEPEDDFPLINLVLERIFDPRTTRAKTPDPVKTPAEDRVTPYFPRFAADPRYGLHLMRPLDYSCYAGSSVFVSTPSDMVRFAMAIHGGKLLQPATVQQLQTPQRLASGEDTGYGLGWDLETVTFAGKKTRVIGHDGDVLGGKSSSLLTVPEHGITVSVMSNISYADAFSLAVQVAEAFAQPATR